jgi:signal transduction histidine kinase
VGVLVDKLHLVTPRAALVFALVAALSIGGFFLVRGAIDNQDRALLASASAQVQILFQTALQNVEQQLRSTAFSTASTGGSQAAFDQQTKALATSPGSSVAVVDTATRPPTVLAATGPDMRAHSELAPALADFAAAADTSLSSAVVHQGSRRLLALAITSTLYPHDAALETAVLHPTRPVPNNSKAYAHIYVNLYDVAPRGSRQLLVTTFGPGPLPSPVASATVLFGSVHWLVEAAQKTPLSGSYAEASPWIALVVGLVVALLLAFLFDILGRRERHAEALVAKRTAELSDAQQVIVRNERLAALGEFAGVLGHELRNPLAAAVNEIFLVRMTLDKNLSPQTEMHLDGAERQVYRAAKLADDLTSYTRDRKLDIGDIDFEVLVDEVLKTTPPPDGITVSVDAATHFDADYSLMTQVITNVVTNAYQAMAEGGTIRFSAVELDGATCITVEDSGVGFDPGASERFFDPFFTLKDGGTGLGLAVVHRFVTLHGGDVTITNGRTGGARVTIVLPHARPQASGNKAGAGGLPSEERAPA